MRRTAGLLLAVSFAAVSLIAGWAFSATPPGPTISVLSPADGSSVSKPSVLVLIQVWDSDATAQTPEASTDGGGYSSSGVIDDSAVRQCGENCKIYKYVWDLSGYANDTAHTIRFRSTDGQNQTEGRVVSITVRGQKTGDGYILVRSPSSQFCIDCHKDILSHSSQTTDASYGNWETVCLDCHTAHNTTNIYVVKNSVSYGGFSNTVSFLNNSGDAAGSYVDGNAPSGTGGAMGICQVCHTQTGGGTPRWRRTGNSSTHYASPSTDRCTDCHPHDAGFSGAGGGCKSCHGYPPIPGDGINAANPQFDGGKGAHWSAGINGAHIDNGALDSENDQYDTFNTICNQCHDLTLSTNHGNDAVEVRILDSLGFDGLNPPDYLGVPGETSTPKTCSNVLCHFKETPRWSCEGDE